MLVRKNTKAFKTIQQLFAEVQDRADRDKLIRLYITKAGDSIQNRISIEGIEGNSVLFYEMTYQTVLNNLKSSNHQLQVSDEVPGVYYFHSSSNKVWDETPFEFDESIKDEFASLAELPAVRKQEAAKKFVLPSAEAKRKKPPAKKEEPTKKEKSKVTPPVDKRLKQPDFELKHPIAFTNLDKLVFRQAKITKQEVLEYYAKIADYLLPWLKNRPLCTRFQAEDGGKVVDMTVDALFRDNPDEMPKWVKTAKGSDKKEGSPLLLCNDKQHLLLYVERGSLEFIPSASRTKDLDSPDYVIVAVESPDSGLRKAVDVALAARKIMTGLKLPSFIKTDGGTGFQILVPLETDSNDEARGKIAEYLCKLIGLKVPELTTLKRSSGYIYSKVSLDYSLNEEGKGIIAPYSLVAGQSPTIATPVLWDELEEGLDVEALNHRSIFERLHDAGDPFEGFFKKRVNARDLLARLDENYGFLI